MSVLFSALRERVESNAQRAVDLPSTGIMRVGSDLARIEEASYGGRKLLIQLLHGLHKTGQLFQRVSIVFQVHALSDRAVERLYSFAPLVQYAMSVRIHTGKDNQCAGQFR